MKEAHRTTETVPQAETEPPFSPCNPVLGRPGDTPRPEAGVFVLARAREALLNTIIGGAYVQRVALQPQLPPPAEDVVQ